MTTVRRWSGHEARVLRRALRMSVRAFADHLGVAARTVSKWEEHGAATFPLPDTQAILDVALGRADDDAKHRFEQLLHDDQDGKLDDVNRRTLLGLLGPLTASPLAGRLEELRRGLDGLLDTEPADRDADDWEQTVADYAREIHSAPASRLLPNLVTDFAEIQTRITNASGPLRIRLIHSAAQLAALTAIALVNLREQRAAQRWWRTASRAANATADPEVIALIHGRHAIVSLHNASPATVLDLADRAVALGASTPCVGVISGLSARAQALAIVGRSKDAARALNALIDMYTELPAAAMADPASEWSWAQYRLRYVESHVHSHAALTDHAHAAQDAALALYPVSNWKGPTQIELHRAATHIRSHDTETGARHIAKVMDRLQPWQRADGRVLPIAVSTLDMVPAHGRRLANFREARELVATATASRE